MCSTSLGRLKGNSVRSSAYLWLSVGLVVLSACKAIPDSPRVQQSVEVQHGDEPALTVTSLDNSIPLGDSFPILVELINLPPNQHVELQLGNLGITPSLSEASVTSDSAGRAELRLTGRAARPQLDALNVLAFFEGGIAGGTLLVNFDPPLEGELQAQATTVGEPTTHAEYVNTTPTLTSLEDYEATGADMPPVSRLNGVRYPKEDGTLDEPMDVLMYNAGTQVAETDSVGPSQVSTCSGGNTYVYLTTLIDGSQQLLPPGTRVTVSNDAPRQTRHVEANGRLCFNYTSGQTVWFSILGWTNTGIYLHDSSDGYRLEGWTKVLVAPYRTTLTAANIRGDYVRVTTSTTDRSYRSLRVFYKINRVYNWERFVPNNPYTSFPLSVVYPDVSLFTTRAAYGRMFIDEAFYGTDRTLFHEFGHEVYYRRMLGADTYRYHHEQAVKHGQAALPSCAGSIGWTPWKHTDGCAGMLEGFALWFEGVSTRAGIGANPSPSIDFEANPGPNTGAAVPGRVTQFLWDITDAHANASTQVQDKDADEVINTTASLASRYSGVARYFKDANPGNSTFTYMYKNRIEPLHPASERVDFCAVVRRNTLAVSGMCG